MRKLIAFDDDTASKLTELARDRMATFQELADEAFADVLKKHGVPIDLQDALRKSVRASGKSPQENPEKEIRKAPGKTATKTGTKNPARRRATSSRHERKSGHDIRRPGNRAKRSV